MKNYKEAISNLNKALDLFEKNKNEKNFNFTELYLGFSHYYKENFKESYNHLKSSYNSFSNDKNVNYFLGICCLNLKDKSKEEAIMYFKKAKNLGFELPDNILDIINNNNNKNH